MLEGLKALLASEKAIAAGVLAICATVLAALGLMSIADWQTYTRDVLIVYVSGKTVQGLGSAVAAAITKAPAPTPAPAEKTDA